MTFPFPFPFVIVGGAGGLSFEFTDGYSPTSTVSSPVTFSSANLGPPSGDRHLAVLVGSDAGAASAVTVAGQSATRVAQGTSANANTSIWLVNLPSGSAGNVVVTGISGRVGIAVYAIYGADDLAVTATSSGNAETTNLSLAVTKGGVVLAVGSWSIGSIRPVRLTAAARLFPDATGATETVSVTFNTNDASWSGLDEDYLGNTTLTVASSRRGACAVSLEPV